MNSAFRAFVEEDRAVHQGGDVGDDVSRLKRRVTDVRPVTRTRRVVAGREVQATRLAGEQRGAQ